MVHARITKKQESQERVRSTYNSTLRDSVPDDSKPPHKQGLTDRPMSTRSPIDPSGLFYYSAFKTGKFHPQNFNLPSHRMFNTFRRKVLFCRELHSVLKAEFPILDIHLAASTVFFLQFLYCHSLLFISLLFPCFSKLNKGFKR